MKINTISITVSTVRFLFPPFFIYVIKRQIIKPALTFQVRKRVADILREHLADDFLPPPTQAPLTASDQGNLVGNLLAKER